MTAEHNSDIKKVYLVTGSAGFIGYFLSKSLLNDGCRVVGIDNINDYYDIDLKNERLKQLKRFKRFTFRKEDISDKGSIVQAFCEHKPDIVINLAAQAGVRYSLENPDTYVKNNISGFYNILEACRQYPVSHLVYASSSSVYGLNSKVPFSETDITDNPVSLYAATKKSNELMAYTYSYLYKIPATGLYGLRPIRPPGYGILRFHKQILRGQTNKSFQRR
jgi:UDP-glucuronate 4-epimerase